MRIGAEQTSASHPSHQVRGTSRIRLSRSCGLIGECVTLIWRFKVSRLPHFQPSPFTLHDNDLSFSKIQASGLESRSPTLVIMSAVSARPGIVPNGISPEPLQRRVLPLPSRHACIYEGCDKTFTRKEHLSRHAKSHDLQNQFPCSECSKSFSRRYLCSLLTYTRWSDKHQCPQP